MATRVIVMQSKTQRPVQFEITQTTRDALQTWIKQAGLKSEQFLFPRVRHQPLQVFDLLEVATLNCHYSNVI